MTSAPKRRIYAVGRRERSKNLKVYSPSPFLLYAFSPRNPRSFCKLFPRGLLWRKPLISLRGGSAKKSKLLVRQWLWCNSILPELRSHRLRCIFILNYKKTLDFLAKCGYNISRGCTKLTVTPNMSMLDSRSIGRGATISFFYCCFALSEWCCKRQEVTWKSHSMSWQLTPISGRRFNRQPFIDVPSYVILLHFPCFVKDFFVCNLLLFEQ